MGSKNIGVLHVVNKWGHGGVERFIEGLAGEVADAPLDHSVLSLCTGVDSNVPFKGKYGPLCAGEGSISILRASLRFGRFLDAHPFDVVHIHASNGSCFLLASISRTHGVPVRIVHSHNSSMQVGSGSIKKLMHRLLTCLFSGNETVRLACSTEAGKHLFGGQGFEIIPNGIDIDRFTFNSQSRENLRSELGISENAKLILCVGSFVEAKNHLRAINIFSKFTSDKPNSLLALLGDGPLRERLESEAERLGVRQKVLMPGFVEDPEKWLSGADAMLFPSLYEGLPIALVEAQCNGLPVICSDAVTREVGLLESCRFLSLTAPDDEWVIALMAAERDMSSHSAKDIAGCGFSRWNTYEKLFTRYGQAMLP